MKDVSESLHELNDKSLRAFKEAARQPARQSAPSPQDDFTELAKKTSDYLYSLSDDCPAELRQPIATLRQLINEEYVGKDKTVGSQLIWDILGKAIQSYLGTKVLEGRKDELIKMRRAAVNDVVTYFVELYFMERLKELTQEQTRQVLEEGKK